MDAIDVASEFRFVFVFDTPSSGPSAKIWYAAGIFRGTLEERWVQCVEPDRDAGDSGIGGKGSTRSASNLSFASWTTSGDEIRVRSMHKSVQRSLSTLRIQMVILSV